MSRTRTVFSHPELRKFSGFYALIIFCSGACWLLLASQNVSFVSQAAILELTAAFEPKACCLAVSDQRTNDLLMTTVTVGNLAYDLRYRESDVRDIVERFAGSFRKASGTADIVFVSPENASADIYKTLQRLNAKWVQVPEEAFVVDGHRLPPGNVARHSWLKYFLTKVAPGQYDRVLIVDATDAYFQTDPFAAVGEPFPDLLLTQEDVIAKDLDFFRQNSIMSGYTPEEIDQCMEPVICGALFLGKVDKLVEFFSRVLTEATIHVQARYDQHFISHLRRKKILDDLKIVYKSDQSLIWHLGKKEDRFFEINEQGLVTRGKNGPVVPILHHIKTGVGKNIFFYLQRFRPPISSPINSIAGRCWFGRDGKIRRLHEPLETPVL